MVSGSLHDDLASILCHPLQGADTSSQYIADAAAAGDDELVELFRLVRRASGVAL